MTSNKFRPWIGIHKRSFNPASSTINFKSIDKPKEKRGPKKEIIIALLPNRPWHRVNDANNLSHNNNIQIVKKRITNFITIIKVYHKNGSKSRHNRTFSHVVQLKIHGLAA